MIFESSQDLLYIVLSLCILWFTVFLCWALYHATRVLRNSNSIVENVSNKLELISEAMEFIRKKVDHVSGHMGMVSSMIANFVEGYVVKKLAGKLEERGEKKKKK
jgi:uncharacterized protein YoxC